MTTESLKLKLREAAQDPDNFVSSTYELVEELEIPPPLDHVKAIIGFMEQNPDIDYGSKGPLTHYIEKFDLNTYFNLVIESVRVKPTMHTLGMLNSCINSLKGEDRQKGLAVLKGLVNDVEVGDRAFDLVSYQQKREPEPNFFAMRVRFGREARIFLSFIDFENFLEGMDFKIEKSLWLSGPDENPAWNMIRRDNLVYLHLFPSERDAGIHLRSTSDDMLTFHADGFDLEIQKSSLTNPATALRIIKQYFEDGTLVPDLDWERL